MQRAGNSQGVAGIRQQAGHGPRVPSPQHWGHSGAAEPKGTVGLGWLKRNFSLQDIPMEEDLPFPGLSGRAPGGDRYPSSHGGEPSRNTASSPGAPALALGCRESRGRAAVAAGDTGLGPLQLQALPEGCPQQPGAVPCPRGTCHGGLHHLPLQGHRKSRHSSGILGCRESLQHWDSQARSCCLSPSAPR